MPALLVDPDRTAPAPSARSHRRGGGRCLAIVVALAIAHDVPAQCTNAWQSTGVVPGIDGNVTAITNWDPDGPGPLPESLVVGGMFAVAGGVPASQVARWDPTTGVWSPLGAGIGSASWPVTSLLVMQNGDLVAGGAFRTTDGAVAEHLARWDGSAWVAFGGLDPVNVGVQALALRPNGDLAVGGWFLTAGATVLNRIGIWNGTAWSPLGSGMNGPVLALVTMQNGDLVAGGFFSNAGGVPAVGIARWNGTTWSSLGPVPDVRALTVLPNGDLVAMGAFTSAGGVTANNIARWNGTSWSALGSGLTGTIGGAAAATALLPNGDLVVGGSFRFAGGVTANGIARWNGSAWSSFGTGMSGSVAALAVRSNGDVVAGGSFTAAGGAPAARIARWAGASWSALAAGSAPSDIVNALLPLPDGSLLAGGRFRAVGGLVTDYVARRQGTSWSALGTLPTSINIVNTLLRLANGDLVAGGSGPIARWNGTAWSPLGTANFGGAFALAQLPNGDLLVGCSQANFLTNVIPGLARWDGTSWSAFAGGAGGITYALATLTNGDLVVGGTLQWVGATPIANIARWNGTTWSTLGSGLQGSSPLVGAFALAPLPNGGLLAGGMFDTAGGVAAANVATWDGTAWSPLGSGTNGPVLALARLPDGDVLAAGTFTQAGGVAAQRIARWNGSTWSPVGAGLELSAHLAPQLGGVRAIASTTNGELLVGGGITSAGGVPSANLARLATTCPASTATLAAGCAGTLTTTLPWTGSTWQSLASGLPNAATVFVVTGFAPTTLPLAAVFATAVPGCTLHVQPDHVVLALSTFGAAGAHLVLPNSATLAGTNFYQQMVPLALDSSLAVTATNALTMTVGTF